MKKNTIRALGFAFAVLAAQSQAEGDAAAGKIKSETCAGCHGEDGNASAPIFPKLAGQHASYLIKQLNEFKSQKRNEPTMNAMASTLSDADIADIAAWFAKQKIRPEQTEKNVEGEKIYRAGIATKAVPACSACHGPRGEGNPTSVYPVLGGQYSSYIVKALHDYRSGERGNEGGADIIRTIASRMSEEEINAVADFISGLH